MKSKYSIVASILAFATACFAAEKYAESESPDGKTFATTAAQKISFHGAAQVAQRAGTATLTDSTGGSTADATLAATAGVSTLAFPVQLDSLTTSAADLLTNYVVGYKFKILGVSFDTTTLGAGSGASQVINLEIGSTNVTGGAVTVTLAGTDTLGELTAGTSVTAANTGSASDTLSIEVAASGTVFTAGHGVLLIKIQNMDVADNMAKTAAKVTELENALEELGLIAEG